MDFDNPSQKLFTQNDDTDLKENRGQRYFGVKSYLHNFYENMSPKNPTEYEDCDDNFAIQHVTEKRIRPTFWTVSLIIGLCSMLCGTIMILVGFTFAKMKIDIGYQEEMRIIDKSAYDFNIHLNQIKVIGLIFFAIGGVFVASALLLPSLMPNKDDNQEESTHFKLRIHDDDDDELLNRSKNLIPITEELKIIQPKQENTTIITNAGLKQIDLE